VTRILLIPVAGTIAALVMIAYAREPRGEPPSPEIPPFDWPDAPEHGGPSDENEPMGDEPLPVEPGEEEKEPEKEPVAEPREYQLRLEADGTFAGKVVPKGAEPEFAVSFASVEDLLQRIGDARHTLVITNGEGVERAKLDEIETSLRDRFKVLKVYRALETPPAEDR
jgi:hypothetical protein